MSYLNQAHDPRRRATAIATVGAVHVLLAVVLVTGLTVDFTDVIERRLVGTTIPLDPPKPEPTPTPSSPVEPVSYVPPRPNAEDRFGTHTGARARRDRRRSDPSALPGKSTRRPDPGPAIDSARVHPEARRATEQLIELDHQR